MPLHFEMHSFYYRIRLSTASDERRITIPLLEKVLRAVQGGSQQKDVTQVIDAFQVPCFVFDPVSKLFHKSRAERKLYADADSKVQVYIDRYNMILQRLRRNRLFRSSAWAGLAGPGSVASGPECELTELKSLLGTVGQPRYVLGFLTQPEEGRYAIEDLSARLPCDISEAETASGLFTENCIVVAEGELNANGVFRISALGLPPPERRGDSLSALQGLDLFGGVPPDMRETVSFRAQHPDDRIIFMSDLWLDQPVVMERIHTVLSTFSSMSQPPSMFVMMGNFQSDLASQSLKSYSKMKESFAALARAIVHYPILLSSSQFILVPGPRDIAPSTCLPRPGLPHSVTSPLCDSIPNLVLASNPCRIRHGEKDIIVFREQLQRRFRALAVVPPGTGPNDVPLFDSLCATILQEGHLMPLPLEYAPVYWEWDHSLYAYPLPHGLVLAEGAPAAVHTFDDCACLNPGSLASGTFGAYDMSSNEMELCDVAMANMAVSEEDEEIQDEVEEVEIEQLLE